MSSRWFPISRSLAGGTGLAVAEEHEGALQVRLQITDTGYACLEGCDQVTLDGPWDYTVQVDQGSLLAVTFVWEHEGYLQEEHVMVLRGYGLEWDLLNSEHREATVELIADSPGTFRIECDLDCELHDFMTGGHLKVGRGGGGGGVAYTATVLTVTPSTWATGGEPVALMVSLRDEKGNAVPKAEVRFYLDAEFVGVDEEMELGRGRTDANGVVFFDFRPTLDMRAQVITARYSGGGVFDESEQSIEILEIGTPPSAFREHATELGDLADRAPSVLVVIIISVWLVFLFVVYQAIGIAWAGGPERS